MAADIPTWIVLVRDLTNVIRVDNQPALFGAMILDADTGLIRGVSMAAKPRTACVEAMRTALAKPADTLPPAVPGAVVCSTAELATVRRALSSVLGAAAPAITEAPAEAEDIFDSLIGHLSGAAQRPTPRRTDDPDFSRPSTADDSPLRWSDADHLDLVVKADGEMRYVRGAQRASNMD
jgi:hypothetical protein